MEPKNRQARKLIQPSSHNVNNITKTKCLEKLKVFYTNADSLLNKFDELNMRLSCDQYDIVCITEV